MTSSQHSLRFAPYSEHSEGSYRLLELPQELCKLVEDGLDTQFTIRGRVSDDAVICTASKTYSVRAVTLSNTFLVITGPSSLAELAGTPDSDLIVRDQISEIYELVPSLPKLHRLDALLKGCEYEEGHEEDVDASSSEEEGPPRKRARITNDDVRSDIQASDAEIAQGVKSSHVLEIDGYLRPLSPSYLAQILESLLTVLVSQSLPLPPRAVSVKQLAYHLDLEQEIPRRVAQQVLPWFGNVEISGEDEVWKMDVKAVVKQVGLGYLMSHKDEPVRITEFLDKWNTAVGDTFASSVELALLEGNYLLTPAPTPTTPSPPTHLAYFPASALPVTTTQLFTDLFLTRPRWRSADLVPFLGTVAFDGKERDKLLMKYARATTDSDGGVWYTARATHV